MQIHVTFIGPNRIERKMGRLVYTTGANALIKQTRGGDKKAWGFLKRHAEGDCPDLDPNDQEQNRIGVETNGYLMSTWDLIKGGRRIWIITEHDRSVTTILTPEEY